MFIELHILQSFAPSNLNRDESNNPKDCSFGGARRARISSQCIKRAIRLHPAFAEETGVQPASRTRLLAKGVSEILQKEGKEKAEAELAATNLISRILIKMDKSDPLQSTVLFYASQEEKQYLARVALQNWQALTAEKADQKSLEAALKEYKENFKNRSSAPDVAMFGRMLAEDPALNLDAACQVAHAISTHRTNMEFDFFTAVDDLQHENETGAGMMGLTGFNAATFYRYASLDYEQLLRNLNDDSQLTEKAIRGFLKASALAVPSGKQNSFAAQNPPSFLMALVRKNSSTWSLANAFEKPVFAQGEKSQLGASIDALCQYWEEVQNFFEDDSEPVLAVIGSDAVPENMKGFAVKSLNQWIDKVISQIDKE
ncbi:MAG: type I-E CRISPR-associated protein Cas7/Cse4/CasC [Anaerolineaceae bacterium]|nr:type I-E CRISPR-associated protein Cas7/Cse4/CasC [Anaerolineaceae bacterium]